MKTKITNISPDQNIIEHESGLRTVFVATGNTTCCDGCVYCYKDTGDLNIKKFACGDNDEIRCTDDMRKDRLNGRFTKLIEP